ncbi:hypothetical protein [Streptomyces lavendulocolor]|uniref:hypothetical protein n=1 Tax=Streptomyces lavendulocolor TaxID=67316 RepID=UPI003C2C15B0
MTITAAQFRAKQIRDSHGDIPAWQPADFDTFEVLADIAHPAYTAAAATGRFVLGRHAEGAQVVVDLATADELAQRAARRAQPPDPWGSPANSNGKPAAPVELRTCWFCGADNPASLNSCGFCNHRADDDPQAVATDDLQDAIGRARQVLAASEQIDYADPKAVVVTIGRLQGCIDNLLDACTAARP